MPSTVTIACNAPSGLIVGTDQWNNQIVLAGAPRATLNTGFDPGFGQTVIDQTLWDAWSAGPGAGLVASGACWKVS